MMRLIRNQGKLFFKIQFLKPGHQWNINIILCILAIFESKGIGIDMWQVMNQNKIRTNHEKLLTKLWYLLWVKTD